MTFRVVVIAVSALWLAGATGRLGVQAQEKSVWDGVYTEEQASRGAAIYATDCSSCHSDDLAGDGFAPALTGPEFSSAWNGLTMGDLLERVRMSMPPTDPTSVSVAQKADVLAHLLKVNKFPAGKEELAKDVASLKAIAYKATKE